MNDFPAPFAHTNANIVDGIPYDLAERFGQTQEYADAVSRDVVQRATAGEFAYVSAEEYRATIRRIETARQLEVAETVRLRTSLEARVKQLEIAVKALVERG